MRGPVLDNDQLDRLAQAHWDVSPSDSLRAGGHGRLPHPCRLHPGQVRDVDHLIAVQMRFYQRFDEIPPSDHTWLKDL